METKLSKFFGLSVLMVMAFNINGFSETIQGEVRSINADQKTVHVLPENASPGVSPMLLKVSDKTAFDGIDAIDELEVGDSVQVEVEDGFLGQKNIIYLDVRSDSTDFDADIKSEYTWGEKLGRGVVNFFTSPVEIPRTIDLVDGEAGAGQAWTVGLVRGIGRTFFRAGAGLLEVVTFPFNFPDEQKQPIIQPEFAWQSWPENV